MALVAFPGVATLFIFLMLLLAFGVFFLLLLSFFFTFWLVHLGSFLLFFLLFFLLEVGLVAWLLTFGFWLQALDSSLFLALF